MHFSKLATVLVALTPVALGQRGKRPDNPPDGECNTMPDSDPDNPGGSKLIRALHEFSHMFERHANLYDRGNITLSRRTGDVKWDDNCNDEIPAGSSYKGKGGFVSKKNVIEEAYKDAVALAQGAMNIDAISKAFKHYFGGPEVDSQLDHFKRMMEGIAAGDKRFTVKFECSGTGGECTNKNIRSVANTDAEVATADEEREAVNSAPFRDLTASGWCSKRGSTDGASAKQAQFFSTAGHTILHELTHLHSLALYAGLTPDPDDNNRAGTGDGQDGCELLGARAHRTAYIADNGADEVARPDYNAESYAAAATELYFMGLCHFSEIMPRTFQD